MAIITNYKHKNYESFTLLPLGTKLETKEQKRLQRGWSSTKHSLKLTCEVNTKENIKIVYASVIIHCAVNEIGNEGGKAIAEALKTNKTLTKLNLYHPK